MCKATGKESREGGEDGEEGNTEMSQSLPFRFLRETAYFPFSRNAASVNK